MVVGTELLIDASEALKQTKESYKLIERLIEKGYQVSS